MAPERDADMSSFDLDSVRSALVEVRQRIDDAGGDSTVAVLPVTKGFGPDAIEMAIGAGCTTIGENYAQELLAKRSVLDRDQRLPQVHFIGQLQTNKVRQLADLVDVYETVDRPRLAREIAKRVPGARVLIQVDTSDERGKGGCPTSDVAALVEEIGHLGLTLDGLMTVGPTAGGAEAARPGFRLVRGMVDRLGLTVCSMGMTADLEVAVQEGSTQIRVGTALFGSRPVPTWRDQER
jgi:pyridoxal phosphate enzyme (YggS family)